MNLSWKILRAAIAALAFVALGCGIEAAGATGTPILSGPPLSGVALGAGTDFTSATSSLFIPNSVSLGIVSPWTVAYVVKTTAALATDQVFIAHTDSANPILTNGTVGFSNHNSHFGRNTTFENVIEQPTQSGFCGSLSL
jgi:hypothetical protein